MFEILGPLRVRVDGREIPVTAGRDRTLLAMLLLHANTVTPTGQLIDAIWPTKTPHDARTQLQGCVSRLRRRLGTSADTLLTDPAGYRLIVAPSELDLTEFRRLVAEARTTRQTGDPTQATNQYRQALALWNGTALTDIESPTIRHAAAALDEEHNQALEERFTTELAAGAGGELVAELTQAVQQHPHREGLHHARMLALYRAGRQADALAAYRHAHQLLADELGTEPGAPLQDLHRAILNRDPNLDAHPPPPSPPPAAPVPRELPADVTAFTGRDDELKALDELLADEPDGLRPVAISAIAGTAGVGKTALAIHWAHRVADRFPDGQLYINLRGYDPGQPMAAADALARLLSALGVASQDIPTDTDERSARYRSLVAGRRILMVLDNASSAPHVRPLLPGSGTCTVLVTSRDDLSGLVAVDGASRLDLDLLPHTEAVNLLRRLIGTRADTDPDAATELVNQCGHLPLTLRVAAELAISRATTPLIKLVEELADQQRRLDQLDAGGDPHAAIKAVFSWSIKHLPSDAARMFRLMGLHPGSDLDAYAAAALTDTDLDQARRMLRVLARAHLLHTTTPDRYGMHDLLRAYAAHLARVQDSDVTRRAALDRLLVHYLAGATAATEVLYSPGPPQDASSTLASPPVLDDRETATAWLDAELSNLVAVAAHSAVHGEPSYAVRLSKVLSRYLQGSRYPEALTIYGHARYAAERSGDLAAQAQTERYIGTTLGRMSQYGPAITHLQQALQLFRRANDQAGEAMALSSIGAIEQWLGRYQAAIDCGREAVARLRLVGDETGEGFALTDLGVVEQWLGRYPSANDHHQQAWKLFHRLGNRHGEAHVLNNLGELMERTGRHESADDLYRQALAAFREVGNSLGEASALDGLGVVELRAGRTEQATIHFERALSLFRDIGARAGEAFSLNGLGEAAHAAHRASAAVGYHTRALTVADRIGFREQLARAHAGLGRAHRTLGDPARAHTHYAQALEIYTDLGVPSAQEVDELLADCSNALSGNPGD